MMMQPADGNGDMDMDRSLLGLDGGNMMQTDAPGAIDTSLMDLNAAMQSPKV